MLTRIITLAVVVFALASQTVLAGGAGLDRTTVDPQTQTPAERATALELAIAEDEAATTGGVSHANNDDGQVEILSSSNQTIGRTRRQCP